jgi:H/ACA ribonucleoprotein complex subunit 4
MPVLMGLNKEYVGVMHMHKEVPEDLLREKMSGFIGKIIQTPPVRAAVARRPREREVYFFDILEIDGKDVLFHVGTEAGTYIRKICSDLGEMLGVGAHMGELRRVKVGEFTEERAHSLVEVKDAYEFWKDGNEQRLGEILIPVEFAIEHVKKVFVKDSAIDAICNGAPVYAGGLTRIQEKILRGERVAVMSLKNEFVALGITKMNSREMLKSNRGTAVRTDRVFMEKGIYPQIPES